jgi:hypothetical protein
MYIVMLIVRCILGIQGGDFRSLRLVPVRTQPPHGCQEMVFEPARSPGSSGHVSIQTPTESPLEYRRRTHRFVTHHRRRYGPVGGWLDV